MTAAQILAALLTVDGTGSGLDADTLDGHDTAYFQTALGYTAENTANKDIDGTLAANSDTKYPSQKATKTYVDAEASARASAITALSGTYVPKATFPVLIGVAMSDETTAITTGTAKVTMRAPFAFTLTAVRASLTTASSSGIPTVDINETGTTVLSTKLTIDANELTSTTAATAAVISDSSIADDAELTFDVDVAGTGAKGLKVWLIGTRAL
jgi:hypothetical protein